MTQGVAHRARALAAVLALALGTSACSFVFVRAPPATVELGVPVPCTRSLAAPLVDGAIALVALSLAVSALAGLVPGQEGDADEEAILGVAGGGAVTGIVFGISSARGARRVDRCRALNRD